MCMVTIQQRRYNPSFTGCFPKGFEPVPVQIPPVPRYKHIQGQLTSTSLANAIQLVETAKGKER